MQRRLHRLRAYGRGQQIYSDDDYQSVAAYFFDIKSRMNSPDLQVRAYNKSTWWINTVFIRLRFCFFCAYTDYDLGIDRLTYITTRRLIYLLLFLFGYEIVDFKYWAIDPLTLLNSLRYSVHFYDAQRHNLSDTQFSTTIFKMFADLTELHQQQLSSDYYREVYSCFWLDYRVDQLLDDLLLDG